MPTRLSYEFGDSAEMNTHTISFSVADKNQDITKKRDLLVPSIVKDYSVLKPHEIEPHFTSQEDIENWLKLGFAKEWEYYKKAGHPMHWIEIRKNNSLIGFAFFEEWKQNPKIWHLRQIVVLSHAQRQGYGRSLISSLHEIEKDMSTIIADTRKLNKKARAFFQGLGFKELEKPHDPELNAETYLGLELSVKDNKTTQAS